MSVNIRKKHDSSGKYRRGDNSLYTDSIDVV